MHSIFAIEPEAINNWNDLRYVVEKFGFNKGLLIGQYPKRWLALVYEACKKNVRNDSELKKIEEKLSLIKKDRLFQLGLPYIPPDWLQNMLSEEIIDHLDGVIVKGHANNPKHHQLDSVNETIFENHRETKVKKQAQCLAKAATYLLFDTTQIILIDPYFRPKEKCIKVLNEMLSISESGKNKIDKVSVFVAFSKDSRSHEDVKTSYQHILNQWVEKGIEFNVSRLQDDALNFDFHARYLLTDKGGLRYDRGFVEPNDHEVKEQETDVICIENEMKVNLYKQYAENLDPKFIVDKLTITSPS